MATGKIRIEAISVNCPTEGCGGGVEGYDGSFTLTQENGDVLKGSSSNKWLCDECGHIFTIPARARKLLFG